MPHGSHPTGYARLTPFQARAVLAALLLTTALFVGITLSPLARGQVGKPLVGAGDLALYRAEIDRIRTGEGYYQAAAEELSSRGYPTRSVFNWRTPLPTWLIGHLPDPMFGKVLLCLLAAALILLSFEALSREEGSALARPAACVALLSGPLMFCLLDGLYVSPCLWCGVFLALSICAYGIHRPGWAVAAGLAAVFLRELALPYCVFAAAHACWRRQWKELAAWGMGLLAWLVFFGLHWLQVAALIHPDARAHEQGWMQFGGAAFVIATAQMNGYLLLLPQWVTALYFMAAMLGFAGWHTPLGQRAGLTVALFVTAFGFVGQEFNQYWGTLIAPLLCFGVVRFPASLADLWRAAELRVQGSGVQGSGFRVQDS